MSSVPKFPSEVEFASLLVYSPSGKSHVSMTSQRIMRRVKLDTRQYSEYLTKRMSEVLPASIRNRFLSPSATLVPVPGCAPLKDPEARWGPKVLCEAFVAAGFGARTLNCLARVNPVPKSSFAAPGQRPTVLKHYESLEAQADLSAGMQITLIDDVITRGRTTYAAAARMMEVFPNASVCVFAVIRTMGLVADVEQVLEPCVGKLIWTGTDVNRHE